MIIRLCLFWVKITSGNAFPYLRVFGCAWKMHFPEMVFSWPCVRCKLISIFILPSNTIFRKTERERERERERAEWEWDRGSRERERAHPSGQPSSSQRDRTQKEIEPRAQSCSTTTSPFNFDFTVRLRIAWIAPFDFAVRLRLRLRLRADRNRSRSTDSSSPITNPDSSSPIAIVAPQNRLSSTPKPIVLPLFLLLSIWPDYDFFFPGFYLCFWIEGWNYIFVWQVRKYEKMCFLCDFDFCCCGGGVLVVVAFDCRSLLPWVELPCEKFVGK